MNLYVDKKYNLYSELNLKNKIKKMSSKDILKFEPKLILKKQGKIIKEYNNIQCLYLYPLNLLDYATNLNKFIFINILKIDLQCDYISIFNKEEYKNLKCVEFLIDSHLNKQEFNRIIKLVEYLVSRNIKINLNLKDLNNIDDCFIKLFSNIDYYKIFLPNFTTKYEYEIFLKKLKAVTSKKNNSALIHIKTYLNINQSKYYEKILNDFNYLNVDIFQVSKELQPLDTDNIKVDFQIQRNIRDLEKRYNNYSKTKFLSVRDISNLYYPRFTLDERNSRICYACKMKPYLKAKFLLPCKVNNITNNFGDWATNINDSITNYNIKIKKCGLSCDDCASIFENDILTDIANILSFDNDIDILLEVEM